MIYFYLIIFSINKFERKFRLQHDSRGDFEFGYYDRIRLFDKNGSGSDLNSLISNPVLVLGFC